MTKTSLHNGTRAAEYEHPSGMSDLRAISFTRSHARAFARDLAQGLRVTSAAYRRALQRYEQGDISRKELRQLAVEFRNYAQEIRRSERGSAHKVSRKVEGMAFGLEKRSWADLGPSSVRPISEILNPEIDSALRKIATSSAVKEALNTRSSDTAYQHLRRFSAYAKTPSGNTTIFLASLESGRQALIQRTQATRCETMAEVVSMTPRDGLTFFAHYLPKPPGLAVACNAYAESFQVERSFECLESYHHTRNLYIVATRDKFKEVAIGEGREDLAQSPETINTSIRAVFGLSESYADLVEHTRLVGLGLPDVPIPLGFFETVSGHLLDHVAEDTLRVLADGESPNLKDSESRKTLTRRLLTQPWSSIGAPEAVYSCSSPHGDRSSIVAPDSSWCMGFHMVHVHPLVGPVAPVTLGALLPTGYNMYDSTDLLRAIATEGFAKVRSNAVDEVEARISSHMEAIKDRSNAIASARSLLEQGSYGDVLATLEAGFASASFYYQQAHNCLSAGSAHIQVAFQIDKHEVTLSWSRDLVEQERGVLQALQEARSAEDLIGALYYSFEARGSLEESAHDIRVRRKYYTQRGSSLRGASVGIIHNSLGSLYAISDVDSGLTNLRYEGPGERRVASIGGAVWLDGDRLSSSEIIVTCDPAMREIPQVLERMMICDQHSGVRRFAVSRNSLLSWLMTHQHAALATALGHDFSASIRMVAGKSYTFVEWPDIGTLQPSSVKRIAALVGRGGVGSDGIGELLADLDRFYRTAPDYENMNPLHVNMPLVCYESAALMERYLAVANAILSRSDELPTEISSLLKLSEDRGGSYEAVSRAICFLERALKVLSLSADDSSLSVTMLRRILNCEALTSALKRKIVKSGLRIRPFELDSTSPNGGISASWELDIEDFLVSEYVSRLQSELEDRGLSFSPLGIVASEGMNHDSANTSVRSTIISDVRPDGARGVSVMVHMDAFLLASDEERSDALIAALQEYEQRRERERSDPTGTGGSYSLRGILHSKSRRLSEAFPDLDRAEKARQLMQYAFEQYGYVDLKAILDVHDASPDTVDLGWYVTAARKVAGRMVFNIPSLAAQPQVRCEDSDVLRSSYISMRDALFAHIEDKDFAEQMLELVKALYQRDKIVRFWDLAMGPEGRPEAVEKFNQTLLESLRDLSGNVEANESWFEFSGTGATIHGGSKKCSV